MKDIIDLKIVMNYITVLYTQNFITLIEKTSSKSTGINLNFGLKILSINRIFPKVECSVYYLRIKYNAKNFIYLVTSLLEKLMIVVK